MAQRKSVITLVGVKQAREGLTFVHRGASSKCEGCEYYRTCIEKLEAGRVYEVVRLYEKVFPCGLHEAGVRVVGVVESKIAAAVPPRLAVEGAIVTFTRQACDAQGCPYSGICAPLGLIDGERCVIVEVGGNVPCPRDVSLAKVALRRVPS